MLPTEMSISPVIISMTSATAIMPKRPVSRSTTLSSCEDRNAPLLPHWK